MTKQVRSARTRRLLLEAAAELLLRDGYADTSLLDIASVAGVTKGGLYFHFSSKDEICDAVQVAAVGVLHEHVNQRLAARLPALQRLADLGHALMHWLDTDPTVGASVRLMREVGARDPRFVAFARAWVAEVHRCVIDARASGELGADVPLDLTTLQVVVTCVGLESVARTGVVGLGAGLGGALAGLGRFGVRVPGPAWPTGPPASAGGG